ncbi:hypothetical protein PMAYCL1PPCAC_21325, partial [Pristionchus mayeri]
GYADRVTATLNQIDLNFVAKGKTVFAALNIFYMFTDLQLRWNPEDNDNTTNIIMQPTNYSIVNVIDRCYRTTSVVAATEDMRIWHTGGAMVTSWFNTMTDCPVD